MANHVGSLGTQTLEESQSFEIASNKPEHTIDHAPDFTSARSINENVDKHWRFNIGLAQPDVRFGKQNVVEQLGNHQHGKFRQPVGSMSCSL